MSHPGVLTNTLRVTRGQTKRMLVTVMTGEGRAVDLSQATVYLSVRETWETEVLVALSSPSNGIKVTAPSEGRLEVTLSSDDTDMEVGNYRYDLWVDWPAEEEGKPRVRIPVIQYAELVIVPSLTDLP